jgi:hypothetical protein
MAQPCLSLPPPFSRPRSQASKHSPLEVPAVEASSKLLIGASVAATAAAALYSI